MFEKMVLKETVIEPALFLAPMEGITHSAFRRLVADFGGYGALFTEMIYGQAILHENLFDSPRLKRREGEGRVFYQLLLSGEEEIPSIIERLKMIQPMAIDLNLGCPAPSIRKIGGGVMLYSRFQRLAQVLERIRTTWTGILTVKCRIGPDSNSWKEPFLERVRLFEDYGIDALFVHPRFFYEKLKRPPRHDWLEWIVENTRLPVVANGDLRPGPLIDDRLSLFRGVKGAMLGRMAVLRPWVFLEFNGSAVKVDYKEVWERFYRYVLEDFPPERAIGKLKEFSVYYARNFFYGHHFFTAVQGARSLETVYTAAMEFLCSQPQLVVTPST